MSEKKRKYNFVKDSIDNQLSFKLIVGLCNPGKQYSQTRHNIGSWFIQGLIQRYQINLKEQSRFLGKFAHIQDERNNTNCYLLLPMTYMNASGLSIKAFSNFYKISSEKILIVHDEINLAPGCIDFKKGGGHAGHNGIRNVIHHLDSKFYRLKIGIGSPNLNKRQQLIKYVLEKPNKNDGERIMHAINFAILNFPTINKINVSI